MTSSNPSSQNYVGPASIRIPLPTSSAANVHHSFELDGDRLFLTFEACLFTVSSWHERREAQGAQRLPNAEEPVSLSGGLPHLPPSFASYVIGKLTLAACKLIILPGCMHDGCRRVSNPHARTPI